MTLQQKSSDAALMVAQKAIAALLQWADSGASLPEMKPSEDVDVAAAVLRAKNTLNFHPAPSRIGALQLLFDDVKLPDGQGKSGDHWCPMRAIADENPIIPYPLTEEPTNEAEYKAELAKAIAPIVQDAQKWQNLSLLSLLLEKYASCLSFGEPNVALVDITRITGAVAATLAQNPDAKQLSLVAGDLSGIQNFIYTISSAGALKSLRARSFYLELVTEEVVQQLLKVLHLPRTNAIYAGGGNLYLLATAQDSTKTLEDVQSRLNKWLRRNFQGKVFLALAHATCDVTSLTEIKFRDTWNKAIAEVNKQKNAKFKNQLQILLTPQSSYEPCRVCHRDDQRKLKPLNNEDSVLSCSTCRRMLRLGGQILKAKKIVRSQGRWLSNTRLRFAIPGSLVFYNFYSEDETVPKLSEGDQLFLINDWKIDDYLQAETLPLLLGNYGQRSCELEEEFEGTPGFMTAEEFADIAGKAGCIPRVGYLRMDVDRLGQIFANGLSETNSYSLPRVAGLSRQMSYFFKTYLNSLAAGRHHNLPESVIKLNDGNRPNLLFIYAGGDDLFVSGAWNEITDFAFDIYQAFRAYTGKHPDITLSGGISLAAPKFPLYQAAAESGKAESDAKDNERDSLCLFDFPFKWKEWFGVALEEQVAQEIIAAIEKKDEEYWQARGPDPNKPSLIGVMPFVTRIQQQKLEGNYSRSFVRNLLAAAQLQEQKIQESKKALENKQKSADYEYQLQDFRYYLHLPQIAYTLAKLPRRAFDDNDEKYKGFRKSLKSPYNAPYFRAIATWIELLTRNKNNG